MKLLAIDGNSLVNRAFYGVRSFTAPDGTPTNAVYGFLAILQKLIKEQSPDAICVAFDSHAPTFRHEQYTEYKAKRPAMPEDLAVQMPILREVLDAMGICRLELAGYEADDILGMIGRKCEEAGDLCLIVTGDKDSFQLITDTTAVLHVKTRMGQTESILYDRDRFFEEYGFEPGAIVDLKALMGDASDNIPGVAGVGEKTAMDLIRRFGSVERIYSELEPLDIKDSVRKKLRDGAESAKLSYELSTITPDVPLDFEPEGARYTGRFSGALYEIFSKLGFRQFIEKWGLSPDGDAPARQTAQSLPVIRISERGGRQALEPALTGEYIAVLPEGEMLMLCDGKAVYELSFEPDNAGVHGLLELVFSPRVKKVSHNVKDFMLTLIKNGLNTEGFIFDTALGAYLLEPTDNNYALPRLSEKYLGSALDGAQAAYELYPVIDDKLQTLGMKSLYYDIELPLSGVLAGMELEGFAVDREALSEFGKMLDIGILTLQKSIYELAGEEFNINSPKQLGELLFDKLMLPHGKKTKTGWSTNAEVLEKLRGKHPVIGEVLDYRQLTKLKATYVEGLDKAIAGDGRIHTRFQMTVTATGRLSSVEPNLQNIPVRTQLGGEIRKMFVAGEGKVLVDADYSQIELRLLAHISGDRVMRQAFLDGEDIHAVTASQVLGIPLEDVTPTQRGSAKAVNFGIVYGISDFSLAQDIGVSRKEARAYIDAYLEKYSGVRDYMKSIAERAKADGYVTTVYGRRRNLPELKSANFNVRAFGERVALNMPIQGAAADIMKIAMLRADRRLKAEGLSARLILQVHDELIAECPEHEAGAVCAILTQEMQSAADLSIPLTAQANSGRNWYEAK